jgi:hypothetical protein
MLIETEAEASTIEYGASPATFDRCFSSDHDPAFAGRYIPGL